MNDEQLSNINAWVSASKKTLTQIAEEAGIRRWALYKILHGRSREGVKFSSLDGIAKAVGAKTVERLLNKQPKG